MCGMVYGITYCNGIVWFVVWCMVSYTVWCVVWYDVWFGMVRYGVWYRMVCGLVYSIV